MRSERLGAFVAALTRAGPIGMLVPRLVRRARIALWCSFALVALPLPTDAQDAGTRELPVEHHPLADACAGAPCPTYDEAAAAARASPTAPCREWQLGTCGALRFVAHRGALGGDTRWYDAEGRLVAMSSYDDTLRLAEYGEVPSCERVVTQDGCGGDVEPGPRAARTTPTRAEVVSAMELVTPAARACLPETLPTLTVAITLRPAGTLASATTVGSAPAPVRRCLTRALRALRVPPFGPRSFTFRYPFRRAVE